MQKVLHQYSSLFFCYDYCMILKYKLATKKSVLDQLQRQQECIMQFLLPSHLLLKMHGCCPNKVCLENLPTNLASSSSIAHKTPVLRNLTIIIIFLFCLICDLNHFSKHRNYSLSHSLHSETHQSIHGISQIFLRDFL